MFSRISSVPKLVSTRLLYYAVEPLVSEQNRVAIMSKKSYKLIYFRARGRGEFIRLVFLIAGVEFEDHLVDFQQNWPSLKASKPMPIIFFAQFLQTEGAYTVTIRFSARGACLLWVLQEGYGSANWCKIHKFHIHSHLMISFLLTNMSFNMYTNSHSTTFFCYKYIHSHSKHIFIYIPGKTFYFSVKPGQA